VTRFEADHAATIRANCAYVRLIEAAGVLAEWEEDERSRRKWQRIRRSAQQSLRKLVEELAPHVTAEIMAASEKVLGKVREIGLN
jgi:hypothetical protein